MTDARTLSGHRARRTQTLHGHAETQAAIRVDIELGICSVQCAGAMSIEGPCRCGCRGDNHGKLWLDGRA